MRQELRVAGRMRSEEVAKGTVSASSCGCWLGALLPCLPLRMVTDRVLTVLQMLLIFAICRRTLEINVSLLALRDQSCLCIFIMSPCLSKSQCVSLGKKIRKNTFGVKCNGNLETLVWS